MKNFVRAVVFFSACLMFALFPGFSVQAWAETGVKEGEIVLGMSNPLTGPASSLGKGMKAGAMAYFDKVNAQGGVNGRKIKVISYDDGYEPTETVKNTNKLIKDDGVFALFGYVGTPTAKAIMPIIDKEKVIFFGPFTGAEFLRTPVNRYIFNVRSSYFNEAETQVEYLTSMLGVKKIGLFVQDDAYGLAVKGGIMRALEKRKLPLVGEGKYKRNTEDVDEALSALKAANPEAVSMVGTYSAMAAFIKKAHAGGFNPVFLNVSFVGTDALVKALGGKGDGTIITQVVPSPADASLPIVKQYQADMKGQGEVGYVSLEGYIDAVVMVEILKRAGQNLTRESFISAAEGLNLSQGGMKFIFSPVRHEALDKVYITKVSGDKVVPVSK